MLKASPNKRRPDRGIALILVIFIVALATILVTNMTYSTHLAGRENSYIERSFQAEYLLKSAVSMARTLIKLNGTTPSKDDPWRLFKNGAPIPAEFLNLNDPNIRVELEIRPEESKLPLLALSGNTSVLNGADPAWAVIFSTLFTKLGFASDNETDRNPPFAGTHFDPDEMVANFADFTDNDETPYSDQKGIFPGKGREGSATQGFFKNEKLTTLSELEGIPGFTPGRVQRLGPFVSAISNGGTVDINSSPRVVLLALGIDDADADKIIAYVANTGPLANKSDLVNLSLLTSAAFSPLSSKLTTTAKNWQIVAKVSYDTSSFFARAYVRQNGTSDYPTMRSFELF